MSEQPGDVVPTPPTYVNVCATTFREQPRHIQFLVIVTFPIYGGVRLTLKGVEETGKKVWELFVKICEVADKVYHICGRIYNYVAPRIWNGFVRPYIIRPIRCFIITPIVTALSFTYDTIVGVCVVVFQAVKTGFTSVVKACQSLWGGA